MLSNANQHPKDNWSVCRIVVTNIEALYQEVQSLNAIHPNGHLEDKYWGAKEFGMVDPCGVGIVFTEPIS
jgi:hypothetical protein